MVAEKQLKEGCSGNLEDMYVEGLEKQGSQIPVTHRWTVIKENQELKAIASPRHIEWTGTTNGQLIFLGKWVDIIAKIMESESLSMEVKLSLGARTGQDADNAGAKVAWTRASLTLPHAVDCVRLQMRPSDHRSV